MITNPPIVHGSFTIERTFKSAPARVFAAWADIDMKARWFIGPPDKWTVLRRELDFRVGGQELLQGEFMGTTKTLFVARYHVIEPNQRLVYMYDMHVSDLHLSVSLATIELTPMSAGGTRMTFTEQAAFLDGKDGTKSRETGTAVHFDQLRADLDDPKEIISTRVFDARREHVFRAFADPLRLATWWGPQGFTNRFETFDLRSGGSWRFVMMGPDGKEYENANEFVQVVDQERISFRHVQTGHDFTFTQTFVELGNKTLLVWRMRFDSVDEADRIRQFVEGANEQNFDRLALHLAATTS